MIADHWEKPATITRNNFVNKSLSSWALNIAVGCSHGCKFCYVPEVSTRKLGATLSLYGVTDPDEEWGEYALLRRWNEGAFLASLAKAERTPAAELNADGNRAVMLCTTTDPYQVFRSEHGRADNDVPAIRELQREQELMVRSALELIRDRSTLNVRILTRSPLARQHFDLFASFGKRLLFGMSLPTLRDDLSRVYEPKAPGPAARLETLHKAKEAGLHVYVAMAPTFPESDRDDLKRTLAAIAELKPVTVFHEPINIRADNVERIAKHARSLGVVTNLGVFESKGRWAGYALEQLHNVEQAAEAAGLWRELHLWPDAGLKNHVRQEWLNKWWGKVSDWPR